MTTRINQNIQNFPLLGWPQELQSILIPPTDLNTWAKVALTCKDGKKMFDQFAPVLKKVVITKAGNRMIARIDERLKEANTAYDRTCAEHSNEYNSDEEFTVILEVFNRYKTKGRALCPDAQIPSKRENSVELFVSIRKKHPTTRPFVSNRDYFDIRMAKDWKVRKDSYDFIDVGWADKWFNGSLAAELYNLTLMKEFTVQYLQNLNTDKQKRSVRERMRSVLASFFGKESKAQ